MNYKSISFRMLIVIGVCFVVNIFCLQAQENKDGKTMFENKCAKCHPLSKSLSKKNNLKQWKAVTLRMSAKANSGITAEEAETIAEYLESVKVE